MEKDQVKTFISYATEYDMYDGHRNWSELTFDEQDEVIKAEILIGSESDEIIMRIGLKKRQAMGLRSIVIYNFMIAEKESGKDFTQLNDEQRKQSILLLRGTAIGSRLAEAFAPHQHEIRHHVDEDELESFAERAYDYLLDIPAREARISFLSVLLPQKNEESEKSNQVKNQIKNERISSTKRRSIFDLLFNRSRQEQQALVALNEIRANLADDDIYISNALDYTIDAATHLINQERKKFANL